MVDDFITGGRRYKRLLLTPDNTTFLYPREILQRLEGLAAHCAIDIDDSGVPLPENEKLSALDLILRCFLERKGREKKSSVRQPQETQRLLAELSVPVRQHLAYLLHASRMAALALQYSQSETPLAFPKGPQGVLANLLQASWIDCTLGGSLPVVFEPLD